MRTPFIARLYLTLPKDYYIDRQNTELIFDRSLVESGPRNYFVVRVKYLVPFAQILEYFTI